MTIYTMGFTQKSAERFFSLIKDNKIEVLIDIRLNNQSQLAGFTKGRDLKYFLENICSCSYAYMPEFAPTKDILDNYKKGKISWDEYTERFLPLIERRQIEKTFTREFKQYDRVLLLCSEPTPECCHRRLVAEYLSDKLGARIIHL